MHHWARRLKSERGWIYGTSTCDPIQTAKIKVKVKVTLEQAKKVHRGSTGIAQLFL